MTWHAGTVSSQTVCQMPVTAVYQMLRGTPHLLAARLLPCVGRIADRDDELLLGGAGLQAIGDVERERIVAAAVHAGRRAVDVDDGFPVDGAEIEQHAVPGGARGRL